MLKAFGNHFSHVLKELYVVFLNGMLVNDIIIEQLQDRETYLYTPFISISVCFMDMALML
jgi:hypothetical protein